MSIFSLSRTPNDKRKRVSISQSYNPIGGIPSTAGNWDGVQIYYAHNHSDPVAAKVYYSSDNSSYTQIATTDSIANGNTGYITATWTSVGKKRYWKLVFTDPGDGNIGGQSDSIREVDWRESGTFITSAAVKTSQNPIITALNIGGTISTVYDGDINTGTTSINEGSYLIFDFGA